MKKEISSVAFVLLFASFANAEMSVAVAHKKATYRWGVTAAEAERAALKACNDPNCRIAMTTKKKCVAGAFPDQNGYFVDLAAGETIQEAQKAAISKCENLIGASCHDRGYGCSNGRGGTEYVDGW